MKCWCKENKKGIYEHLVGYARERMKKKKPNNTRYIRSLSSYQKDLNVNVKNYKRFYRECDETQN